MTDNNQSNLSESLQSDAPGKTAGGLDPIRLIGSILAMGKRQKSAAAFAKEFVDHLLSQSEIIQAAIYVVDQNTREINLETLSSKPPTDRDLQSVTIAPRSSETLARVARSAQPFAVTDLGTELVEYQKGILNPSAKSLFIAPYLVDGEVKFLLDIQSAKSFGLNRDDAPGLFAAFQIFGELRDQIELYEKSGLKYPEMVTFSRITRDIITAKPEQDYSKLILAAFQFSDLVAFLFDARTDHLILEDLYDTKGTGFDASLIGLKVEIPELRSQLSAGGANIYTDLPSNIELGDLFSFFIRRECSSLALLPLILSGQLEKLLVIGSRGSEPINQEGILVYQRVLEMYQARIAFDKRAQQSNDLERDLQFLLNVSSYMDQGWNLSTYLGNISAEIRRSYDEKLLLAYAEFLPGKSLARIYKAALDSSTEEKEVPVAETSISFLDSCKKAARLSDLGEFPNDLFPGGKPDPLSWLVPVLKSDELIGLFLVDPGTSTEVLQTISPIVFDSLGILISNQAAKFNLRNALSQMDQTVTRTVNRQQLLNQISIQAGTGRTQMEILGTIPSKFVELSLCEQAGFFMMNPEGSLDMRVSQGFSEEEKAIMILPGEKLAGKAFSTKDPAIFKQENALNGIDLIKAKNRSGLSVPVIFGDDVFAVLQLEHSQPDQYNDYDLELFQIFALGIGSLIANIRLVDQVRSQVNRQEQLFEVTNKLRRSLDMQSILQISATEIARITNARKASIQVKVTAEPEDIQAPPGSVPAQQIEPVQEVEQSHQQDVPDTPAEAGSGGGEA